jgi:hypothetical protein
MNSNSPFLLLEQDCRDAVDWIIDQFSISGLQAVCTFDLQVARQANVDCPCPNHGTRECNCQMVIMLVYKSGHLPISIVAHGYDGQTWFSIVDSPQQHADPKLEAVIRHAVSSHDLPPVNHHIVPQAS